jgi:hypothetical protein
VVGRLDDRVDEQGHGRRREREPGTVDPWRRRVPRGGDVGGCENPRGDYAAPDGPPRLTLHVGCGGNIGPDLRCDRCGGQAGPGEIELAPGPGAPPADTRPAATTVS